MGDNIEYNTVFQGGSRGYLDEDTDEAHGTYDSMNSAVNIIEKLGPLAADAPYVIEFKKEPQPADWANFMISCQGIGDDISISDLYGTADAIPGTFTDQSDTNLYTNTTSMTPAYNTGHYTPPASVVGAPAAYLNQSNQFTAGSNSVDVDWVGLNSRYFQLMPTLKNTDPGYYLVTLTTTVDCEQSISTTSNTRVTSPDITGKKSVIMNARLMIDSGYRAYATYAYAVHVTSQITTGQAVFSLEFTSDAENIHCYAATATVAPLSAAQYEAIPSVP